MTMATVPTMNGNGVHPPPPAPLSNGSSGYTSGGGRSHQVPNGSSHKSNTSSYSNGFHAGGTKGSASLSSSNKKMTSFSTSPSSAPSPLNNGRLANPSSSQSKSSSMTDNKSSRTTPSPVSYEMFAPRDTEQRSRLSRIQALTSGLSGQKVIETKPNNNNDTNNTSTDATQTAKKGTATTTNPMILPPAPLPTSTTSSMPSDTTDNETAQIIQSALSQANKKSNQINTILQHSTSLTQTLHKTSTLISQLSSRHESLLHHSSELSLAAERLQSESDQLTAHAQEIGLPLKHYDGVDRLGLMVGVLFRDGVVVRGLARVKVDDTTEFVDMLKEIEEVLHFFKLRSEEFWLAKGGVNQNDGIGKKKMTARQRYESESTSGSVEYYKRSLVLQETALDLLKEAIVTRIVQTTDQVISALDLNRRGVVVKGDVLEASLIYTRFHGISKRTNVLLGILQNCIERKKQQKLEEDQRKEADGMMSITTGTTTAAAKRKEEEDCPYKSLWHLCRNTYTQARESLLRISVRTHLDFLREKHGLVGMTRLASLFLIRLCTVETALYLDFFGSPSSSELTKDQQQNEKREADANGKDTKSISTSSSSNTIQRKANAAVLAGQIMAKDGTYYDPEFQAFLHNLCSNIHRTIRRGLVSVSDLDTLCQIVSVLREERSLANASPTTMAAARSLGKVIVDAQERLIFCANSALGKDVLRFKAKPSDLDYPDKLRRNKEEQEGEGDSNSALQHQEQVKQNEKAQLLQQNALKSQMQVYNSWFPPIQSVLKILSKIFRVVEPKVFEDIALTGVQACSRILKDGSSHVEKKSGALHSDLFLVKHLLILREQLSPFDIELRSIERQLDFSDAGKAVTKFLANRNRRLFSMSTENALVTLLCEGLATSETSIDSKRDLEDALRSACNEFIEHTTVRLAGPVLTFVEQCKSVGGDTAAGLQSKSFMTVEYVKAIVTRTLDRLEPELGEVTTQMKLYMDNPATASILLRPIIRKIVRVLEEAKRFITESTNSGNDGEDSWNEDAKTSIFKLMDEIEAMVKASSPR